VRPKEEISDVHKLFPKVTIDKRRSLYREEINKNSNSTATNSGLVSDSTVKERQVRYIPCYLKFHLF